MKLWKKLDLLGRAIVLLSIAFQLMLVSELQILTQKGDIAYLMENQFWIASMIYNESSSSKTKNEIENRAAEAYSRIMLYSEWEKSNLHLEFRITNIIFIVAFLIGSALTILGRYLEINEPEKI